MCHRSCCAAKTFEVLIWHDENQGAYLYSYTCTCKQERYKTKKERSRPHGIQCQPDYVRTWIENNGDWILQKVPI